MPSRYEAEPMGKVWWAVHDRTADRAIVLLTKTQAHIIAFALNAVAEGRILVSLEPRNAWKPEMGEQWYAGPREGVAPSQNMERLK